MSRRRQAWCTAMLACAVAASCRSSGDDDSERAGPVPVTCEPARSGLLRETVALTGVVSVPPDRDAVVAAAVAGRVVDVRVREGDRVRAGDLLAIVDDPSLAATVGESDAARDAAKAAVDAAEAALARAQRLYDEGISPHRDVEDAAQRRAVAVAELKAAEARHSAAGRQQARARLRAPIAGVVVHVLRRAGELVDGTPATPVVEIADPEHLELRAEAPAAALVRVHEGDAAEVRIDALPEHALRGRVVFVSPAVDATTSLGLVRAAIDPPEDAGIDLKLGLAGSVAVEVGRVADAVLVPEASLRRSTEGTRQVIVCVAAGGSVRAEVREVEVGARDDGSVQIRSGVTAGERVVTDHVLGLDDGAALEPAAKVP